MAPPFTYLQVVGTYTAPDGTAIAGDIRFIPSSTVTDQQGNVVVPAVPITVTLDGSGAFAVNLLVTDDEYTQPSGWVWRVSELFSGGREWEFALASALTEPVQLADLTPVTSVSLGYSYATAAQFASLDDRVTSVEQSAGLAVAAVVIHPFLVMGS